MEPLYDAILREGWPLHERIAAARSIAPGPEGRPGDGSLPAWQRAVAPQGDALFARRLAWAGLTLAQAAWALAPPRDAVPPDPDWLPVLKAVQAACRAWDTAAMQAESDAPFAGLLKPMVEWAARRLVSQLPSASQAIARDAALGSFAQALLRELSSLMTPVLYKMFGDTRGAGATLLASFRTEHDPSPPQEEYESFLRMHLADGLDGVLRAYPALGRLIAVTLQHWLANSERLLQRVAADLAALQETFGVPSGAVLQDVSLSLGDAHRDGQTVVALTFGEPGSGAITRVIYKPRSLALDQAFQEFLVELNGWDKDAASFRVLKVLPRDGYGYVEFVEHTVCESDTDLKNFYTGAGRLLAVLHVLACNDCHHENLIASQGQLVLIDLETLLQPVPTERSLHSRPSALERRLAASVLTVGLLPQWRYITQGGRTSALDLSALASTRPQGATFRDVGWLDVNTDAMRQDVLERPWKEPATSPVSLADDSLLLHYRKNLIAGFYHQMQLLLQHRGRLLAPAGPLGRFEWLRQRVVLRPSQLYSTLAAQARQPDALESAAARGIVLEQLSRKYLTEPGKPFDWPVFECEVQQMEHLDIPYFELAVDRDCLLLSPGESISGFVSVSGLSACRARIEALCEEEIRFQQQLISGAIDARYLQPSAPARASVPGSASVVHASPAALEHLDQRRQREALRIARAMQEHAVCSDDGSVNWLGMELGRDGERFSFGPLGTSLYSGSSGVALFLAAMAQSAAAQDTPMGAFAGLAGKSIAGLLDSFHPGDSDTTRRMVRDRPLGLSGTGGLLLTLLLLEQTGLAVFSDTLLDCAMALARCIPRERVQAEEQVDVINGVAGLIGPLLMLSTRVGEGKQGTYFAELAAACGDIIIEKQQEDGAWPNPAAKKSLTGFSHGASGIVAALGRLHRVTGCRRTLQAARGGLGYERAQYSPGAGNWPDFRTTAEPALFMNSWCHGAAGIALARLCLRGSDVWEPALQDELDTALVSTARAGTRGADHLCCGTFGRAAILELAGRKMKNNLYMEQGRGIIAQTMSDAEARGGDYLFDWQSPVRTFVPGLFNGYAGIGLALQATRDAHVLNACLTAGLL